MSELSERLDVASRVLWRCAVLGAALLLIWFAAFTLAGELIYRQAAWFGLTRSQCAALQYGGMGLLKLMIFVWFLVPYLAIRWLRRSHARRPQ